MKNEMKDDEDIFIQTEIILKKINEQMRLTEEALNLSNFSKPSLPTLGPINKNFNSSKSMVIQDKNKNQNTFKIREAVKEFICTDQDYIEKPGFAPFDEKCSFCDKKMYFNKYICIVCDCVLCPKCEINHEHPVLKCKNNQLSSLESIFIYINTKNPELKNSRNSSGFLSNIFANKYELKIECLSDSFSMRPNSKKDIPITIHNLCGADFDCDKNKVTLYGRNNKNLKVNTTYIKDKMNKNDQIEALVTIESKENGKEYDFCVELYSLMGPKLKCNSLSFNVKIYEDKEDEELNTFFKDYPQIAIQSKKYKEGVKKLMQDTKNKYEPVTILKYLKENEGNVDETYYHLINSKK